MWGLESSFPSDVLHKPAGVWPDHAVGPSRCPRQSLDGLERLEMGRPLRYVPEGGSLVEVTVRTIHGRYLLRPDWKGRVNETVIGVLGHAQRQTSMSVVDVSVLSKEIGRLHRWPGRLDEGT